MTSTINHDRRDAAPETHPQVLTISRFLRVGVQGLDPYEDVPLPDDWPVPAPLLPTRDVALAGLMVAAGTRVSEARLVLIDEVPAETTKRPWPSLWMRFVTYLLRRKRRGLGGQISRF